MRQNQDYKNEALSALSGNWPQALIASIILFITGALYVGADGADSVFTVQTFPTYIQYGSPLLLYLLLLPLSVGFCNSLRCLLETGDGRITNNMFSIAFGNWLHLVGGMIVMNIYILLWTLLLIIPGIIKAYSYSMTQFILVEHPELVAQRLLRFADVVGRELTRATDRVAQGRAEIATISFITPSMPESAPCRSRTHTTVTPSGVTRPSAYRRACGVVGSGVIALTGLIGVMHLHRGGSEVVLAGSELSWLVSAAFLVVVATAIAYLGGMVAIRILGNRRASFIALTEVLFAALASWLLLDETLTILQAVGAVLVVGGVVLVQRGAEVPEPEDGEPGAGQPDAVTVEALAVGKG